MRKVLYILADLDDAEIDWLVVNGERRSISAGATLIRQGEAVEEVFILLRGELSVGLEGADAEEIARLRPGEVVGELSFLDARPPSTTVRALSDCVVYGVAREALRRKLEQDERFAAHFYRALGVFLADRLRRTVRLMGYGRPAALSEEMEADDELDEDSLDSVDLAARRFEYLLGRFLEA